MTNFPQQTSTDNGISSETSELNTLRMQLEDLQLALQKKDEQIYSMNNNIAPKNSANTNNTSNLNSSVSLALADKSIRLLRAFERKSPRGFFLCLGLYRLD